MSKKERAVRLIASVPEDRVWAALMVLGGTDAWVSIDAVGDFLRKRQLDAAAVKFDANDPNTRYALRPRLLQWKMGWEDGVIAKALSDALDHDFINHTRLDGMNVFQAKKIDPMNLWKLRTTSTPTCPDWAPQRVLHVQQAQA